MLMYSISALFLLLILKESLQSCSSTAAITTCTWDTLKPNKPLQINDYKTYLSFSKGNLETITNGAFKFFPQLTVLQLSNNKINNLNDKALEGLGNLKHLNLYDNQLTAVKENTFMHCSNLEKLDLGMNQIASIHDKAFEPLQQLVYLNLAFNSLKSIPSAINTLPQLRSLKLDNNRLENKVISGTFSNLHKLETLSLNDNKLKTLEQGALKGLSKLKKLDLRSNFLNDLNVDNILSDARNLDGIKLSLNDFKCDGLRKILGDFKRNNVEVAVGVSRSPSSVHGISCK